MPRTKAFDPDTALRAAMHVFWKDGYKGASMQTLLDAMGINRASLYDTFGDKQALFEQALTLYLQEAREGMAKRFAQSDNVLEVFRGILNDAALGTFRDPETKGCMVVNLSSELTRCDAKAQDAITARNAELDRLFAAAIAKGQASGELTTSASAETLAGLVRTLSSGLNVVAKSAQNEQALTHMVDAGLAALKS